MKRKRTKQLSKKYRTYGHCAVMDLHYKSPVNSLCANTDGYTEDEITETSEIIGKNESLE